MSVSKRSIPFQGLEEREKQNLALAALFFFYVCFLGWQIATDKLVFGYGADFLAFWSGGYIANTYGYEEVYDIKILDQVQRSLINIEGEFSPLPVALFSIFVAPFQVLAHLDFTVSFWIWTSINLIAFVLYLYFFLFRWTDRLHHRLVFMMALSFPLFFTLLEGQMNVWLVILIGEFIRAFCDKKPFRAGLWLGGLLLKPQTLVLIIPFLIIRRFWKTIAGFAISSSGILLISLVLAGWQGMQALLMLWLNFAEGIPTNGPENMMNWRMIALHLGNLSISWLGWLIALVGIIACLIIVWKLWQNISIESYPPETLFVWVILGTLAATCAITWHAHLHMSMILIPPVAYLLAQEELKNQYRNIWLFLLPITFLSVFIFGILLSDPLILVAGHLGGFLLGFCGLFINILLLVISLRQTEVLERNL